MTWSHNAEPVSQIDVLGPWCLFCHLLWSWCKLNEVFVSRYNTVFHYQLNFLCVSYKCFQEKNRELSMPFYKTKNSENINVSKHQCFFKERRKDPPESVKNMSGFLSFLCLWSQFACSRLRKAGILNCRNIGYIYCCCI